MSQASRSGNTPSALSSALRFFRRKRADPDNVDTGDGRFSIPSEVCSSTHAEGLVLFHTGRDLVFQANQTGSRIWQGVARGDRLDVIATELTGEYGIPEQEAKQTVVDFIRELQNQELVIPTR